MLIDGLIYATVVIAIALMTESLNTWDSLILSAIAMVIAWLIANW